ncbi:MAG TPA: hypothetical protein P5080_05745 [Candidatus Paceibacterota bacterium]|nr:hypothetical protein [Candidatus Pacearchaeota archaeon]HRZ51429.1 hypothetical protein [Candidatus Paceibacterota bacterium]HSA37170.1 hypothetical protein [Candidatus Paceibacterota bacterium]
MLIQIIKDKTADKSVKKLKACFSLLFLAAVLAAGAITGTGSVFAAFEVGSPTEDSGGKFLASGQEKSYLLSVDYKNSDYTVSEVSLLNAKAPDRGYEPETGFRCEIVSVGDEILDTFKFSNPKIQCSDSFGKSEEGGCKENESGQFSFQLPYYDTGSQINIYDANDKMVLSADISDFAKLCGDNVCEENENAGTCPSDCRSGVKDGVCDRVKDGTCDPDCAKSADPDCSAAANYNYLIVIAAVLLLAGIGYFIWQKKKGGAQASQEGQGM